MKISSLTAKLISNLNTPPPLIRYLDLIIRTNDMCQKLNKKAFFVIEKHEVQSMVSTDEEEGEEKIPGIGT